MRVLIVCDEDGIWYARRVRLVEHDLDKDEQVYRCDLPIGGAFEGPDEAITAAIEAMAAEPEAG